MIGSAKITLKNTVENTHSASTATGSKARQSMSGPGLPRPRMIRQALRMIPSIKAEVTDRFWHIENIL